MNYRPATAADVGRTDVEFSCFPENEILWTGPDTLIRYRDELDWKFVCNSGKRWSHARVPILPEECDNNVQNVPPVTIRRKLEAGGLAEAEQAILLDGRYYPVEWVKSSPGVLPEQCEIV